MDEISTKEKEALLEIARKTLVGMEELETFEPQNSDSLDFIEVFLRCRITRVSVFWDINESACYTQGFICMVDY